MPLTVEEEALLSTVPDSFWARSKFDFGNIKGACPVIVQPKSTFRPVNSCWFSVIDIANAYFSIPVHPDSKFLFAFTFNYKRCHRVLPLVPLFLLQL